MSEWKQIPEFPNYECNQRGEIRNKRGHMIAFQVNNGYSIVTLRKDKRHKKERVHRLIAKTWIGAQPSPHHQVNHKDGKKMNNHVDNLEWCTPSDNMKHFFATRPQGLPKVKLRFSNATETLEFKSMADAAKHFEKALSTIWGASIHGKWRGYKVERVKAEPPSPPECGGTTESGSSPSNLEISCTLETSPWM